MSQDKPERERSKFRWRPVTKQDLEEMEERIMATMKDLDDEIATELTTAVNSIVTTVTTLESKIAAGVDTSTEIASLKSLSAALQASVAGAPK